MKKIIAILLIICSMTLILASCGEDSSTPSETPETLVLQGKYSAAYAIADASQKKDIWAENAVAVLSEKTSDMLKNPDSFVLRQAYFYGWINSETDKFGQQAVIYSSGENSFGGTVSSYFVWMYNSKNDQWDFVGSSNTTETEKGDSTADIFTKVLLKDILEKGTQLSKPQINNINKQFEQNSLYTVTLIPISSVDKSLYEEK